MWLRQIVQKPISFSPYSVAVWASVYVIGGRVAAIIYDN
jgi:hypothetical protein